MMDAPKFKAGERVTYIPDHAQGDELHPDCEQGIVKRQSDLFVFVNFGRLDGTPQACSPFKLLKGWKA